MSPFDLAKDSIHSRRWHVGLLAMKRQSNPNFVHGLARHDEADRDDQLEEVAMKPSPRYREDVTIKLDDRKAILKRWLSFAFA